MSYTNKQRKSFATSGPMPADVTAQDLADIKDKIGWSALHTAACNGHLPKTCTAKDLSSVRTNSANQRLSALHVAAMFNHVPVSVTLEDLANDKNKAGKSALDMAIALNHLPKHLKTKKSAELIRQSAGKPSPRSRRSRKCSV